MKIELEATGIRLYVNVYNPTAKKLYEHCGYLDIDEIHLRERLTADVEKGIRTVDVIDRSVERIPMYQTLDSIKIDTSNKTVQMIADEITQL